MRAEVKPNLPSFVFTYRGRLKTLGKTIHQNFNLLYMNDKVKDTFRPGLMVSVRAAQKT